VIRIEGLGKTYRTAQGDFQALRGIDMEIAGGDVFGIIGRSGAGKSTLLRTLNLLERPSEGRVYIDGEDVTLLEGEPLRRLRQRVGVIFQHFNLLHSRSVSENVRLPLRIAGELSKSDQARRVKEVLDLVGLADQANKYPRQLSGGQQQRVGIARALANKPTLLLCDEATSALDPETTQSILRLLADINRQLGLTIVLITHDMNVIRAVANNVVILDHGRIVESGKVLDVFLDPRHQTTQSLLAEIGVESAGALAAARSNSSRILRLTYQGATAESPVLSRWSRESRVDFTILQGSVGRLKGSPYGQLTIEMQAPDEVRFQRLVASLANQGVRCEVLR
jgi:D-methionine transport system ATP-binding protein